MSRKTRIEKEFAWAVAKRHGISKKQAKKKYVTKIKDMGFLDE
jgi:hypothetical protein